MYRARFLYDVYEEKYAIIPYKSWGYINDGKWHLGKEHLGIPYPMGYLQNNVCKYIRIKEEGKVFHEEDINVEFEKGNKIRIDKEKIKIIDVIKNLDGSIDYITDKEEFIPINTKDTYFDERLKKQENIEHEELQEVKAIPMDEDKENEKSIFFKGYKSINRFFRNNE